jgi:hypothetical protein
MNIETFKSIFDEEYKKFLAQKEQETVIVDPVEDIKVPTFEEDPIGYILYAYPSLTESLVTLLTDNFKDYITGIYIIAPIPTTFKIILHNNQSFYMIYMGKTWMAKVFGKKYYLLNVGERGRSIEAIARLLTMGSPMGTEPSGDTNTNSTSVEPLSTSEEGGNPFAEPGIEGGGAAISTAPTEEEPTTNA